MRTRLKNRLTVILMMLIFVVISAISVTIIFALTQQQVTTDMSVEYYPETVTDNNSVTYTFSNGGYIVTSCDKSVTNVTIPATINGKNVTAISASAFAECYNLTKATLPNTLENIGNYAFESCTGLTEFVIPDSVTNNGLGYAAFKGCSSLESLTLGSKIIDFDISWIFYCRNLNTITIKSNEFSEEKMDWDFLISEISENLETVITPDFTFEKNGTYLCVSEGSNISDKITIPETFFGIKVREISYEGFKNCTNLTEIIIPSRSDDNGETFGVTSIEDSAFYGCTNLTSVTREGPITYSMGSSVFEECESLTNVELGYPTAIGERAFYYCTSLESLTLPESLSSIEAHAFELCVVLSSITIPASVTYIGEHAFYCAGLMSATFEDTTKTWSYAQTYNPSTTFNVSNAAINAQYLSRDYTEWPWIKNN